MKYLVFSFLLLGLASCSFSSPFSKNSEGSTVIEVNTGGVQVSDSGISVSSESGSVSVGADGNISVKNNSGSVSISENAAMVTSSGNTVSAGKDGVKAGTGIQIPARTTDDMEKDPEVEKITKEIDNLFSDIEKGGK